MEPSGSGVGAASTNPAGAPKRREVEFLARRWGIPTTAAVLLTVLAALLAVPAAGAASQACVITVTTVGGHTITFTVAVPAGTPLSSIPLPLRVPVLGLSESCSPTPTSTTPVTTTTGTTTPATAPMTTSAQGPTTTQSRVPRPSGKARVQRRTRHLELGSAPLEPMTVPERGHSGLEKLRGAGGVPSVTNPTFSFALPGAAPLGVPNFFIDSFAIPPFLLPIYQAAGIEYDVPWQALAAINEIETDYGRNLTTSTSGAIGWMQFLPSTWRQYGVDATGSGYADPYNPVDAIFGAARYLQAAGAGRNLAKAIFAYNHASWYVQSVLLRAQLIGGMPKGLIGALTGLVQGHFPVAAAAKYADDQVERLATGRMRGANAAIPITSDPTASGTAIYARQGSPVIAVNDGKVLKIGHSTKLGRYVILQDQTGNTYTYANLGEIPAGYAAPKPVRITAADIAHELSVAPGSGRIGTGVNGPPTAPAPTGPATAGDQATMPATATTATAAAPLTLTLTRTTRHAATAVRARPVLRGALRVTGPAPLVKERLFANPTRPASYAAGGERQLTGSSFEISRFTSHLSDVLHLARDQYTLHPLQKGAIVVAGTILGRIGPSTQTSASHLYFMIQPAGAKSLYVDPKPILDGWKLLEATAVYRAAGVDPFFGPNSRQATIGQILLESKQQLQHRVLADPHAQIYACGRRDIAAGTVDRRILASIEYLTSSGLDPAITGLQCGATRNGTNGVDQTAASGDSMDISQINGIPVLGHQSQGSITDITIRRLLTLQGALAPTEIISQMNYKGQPTTLSLPDHANRIQVAYTPQYGQNRALAAETRSILKPHQWIQLIDRISQIPEPTIPTNMSRYAFRTPARPQR